MKKSRLHQTISAATMMTSMTISVLTSAIIANANAASAWMMKVAHLHKPGTVSQALAVDWRRRWRGK
jgi:hypothetical protein